MPRFTILWHQTPDDSPRSSHWDLLLESGDHLLTWALSAPPDSAGEQISSRLPAHRPLYLDYQGPLSNDRGQVQQWDTGTFTWRRNDDDRLVVLLTGNRLRGEVELVRDAPEDTWRYRFRPA